MPKHILRRFWLRTPTIIRAFITALAVATASSIPWAILAKANLRYLNSMPWAIVPTGLYMWFFWRYIRGHGWPQSTAMYRRENSRANPLSPDVWGAALIAGVLGLAAVVLLLRIVTRLVALPAESTAELSGVPAITMAGLVVMGAVVAGIGEESSFRGYLQRPIERRYGPAIAILITGCLFSLAHLSHLEVTLALLPYYVAVATVYGLLAYFTDSILPSMVLHIGGNVLGSIDLLTTGRSEWQAKSTTAKLIWETGTDRSFWISCALFVLVAIAAFVAYVSLARTAKARPSLRANSLGNSR